jgi:prepilin-type N-terminal cleavage/methylation domain-containing protein
MHKITRTYGFTLIELLVSITILLIVTGGAIAGFMTFRDRREADETARQVLQLFVSAQQKAAVKETPTACITAGRPLQGYRVNYDAGAGVFQLLALCAANPLPPADANDIPASFPTTSEVESVTVPNAVTVVAGQTTYDYFTLERGTSRSAQNGGDGGDTVYTFTNGTGYGFTVTAGGSITNVD